MSAPRTPDLASALNRHAITAGDLHKRAASVVYTFDPKEFILQVAVYTQHMQGQWVTVAEIDKAAELALGTATHIAKQMKAAHLAAETHNRQEMTLDLKIHTVNCAVFIEVKNRFAKNAPEIVAKIEAALKDANVPFKIGTV